jgi:hypothetical protein
MSTKGWNWQHLETFSQAILSALERKQSGPYKLHS